MRTMLALGILAFAMLGAGPPICGSEGVARADDSAAAPKKSDRLPDRQLVPGQYESLMQWSQQRRAEHERLQALKDRNPQVERERRRELRRGDFRTQDEIKQLFDPPATFGR